MAYAEEPLSLDDADLHHRVRAIAAALGREWSHTAGILETLARTYAVIGRDDLADHLRSRAPRARLEGERAVWLSLTWHPAPGTPREK